ncbi:UbiD family decarboxylase, partial [Myxococcota bacterium]|nr:UbiD family decarboxylase [Myxococcota bacterium]
PPIMTTSQLQAFIGNTHTPRIPHLPSPRLRGEKLRDNSPFITEPSNKGLACGGHLISSPAALAAFLGHERLEDALHKAMPALLQMDCPSSPVERNSRFVPFNGTLADLPFFSLPGLPLRDYLTSGIVAVGTENRGLNLSYHRMQYIDEDHLVMRVVHRHLHELLAANGGTLRASILLGVSPAIAIAAAFPAPSPGKELALAGRLLSGSDAIILLNGLHVPVQTEVVLTGTFTGETHPEGPFIDITGTCDFQRMEPVFHVEAIFTGPDAIIPMILPSGAEHALLMGLPRAVNIYSALGAHVSEMRGVALPQGGCGWLHAVVSCESDLPPRELAAIAFAAHPSMKRLTLVNTDIDPHDPVAVEWAVATRCQPHLDIQVIDPCPGSSLDPSANNGLTSKWVIDATIPPDRSPDDFRKLL